MIKTYDKSATAHLADHIYKTAKMGGDSINDALKEIKDPEEKEKIKSELTLFFRRIKYGKVSVFRKCPRCKAVIRFPRKKGEHRAKCPACGEKFRVKVIF